MPPQQTVPLLSAKPMASTGAGIRTWKYPGGRRRDREEEPVPCRGLPDGGLVVVVEGALTLREEDVRDAPGLKPRAASCLPW